MDLVELDGAPAKARHPWEEARRAFLARVLRDAGLPARGDRVLDVGSGDAWLASRLAEETGAQVVCWDPGYAHRRPAVVAAGVQLTASAPEGRFPLVLALDVAEHVEEDGAFVAGLVRDRLADGGHLLFSVPAWPGLFSRHDERLRHVRRYVPADARALLERASLEIVRGGGLFHGLLAPRAAMKVLERFSAGSPAHAGEWGAPPWMTRLVGAALSLDTRASLAFARIGWDVPGLSWWALCRRR